MLSRETYARHVERLMLNEHVLRYDRRTERMLRGIIVCVIMLIALAAWWGLGQP